jgi:hypothetical protein
MIPSKPAPKPEAKKVSVTPTLTPLDRARIDRWIRDRVVADWRDSCWRCRRPIIPGQPWVNVAGDGVVARFHAACAVAWRTEQETAALKALGLAQRMITP